MRIAIDILLGIGVFFILVGVLGVNRMPDVFGRLQASTCIATMGTISVVLAGILYAVANGGETVTYVKLGVLLLLVMGTNPISNHALCKAAYKMGVKPARELVIDDYKEDDPE
ncbi:MAG: monovalent cation/H(+) antiporter subunit G [Oscillospiraceae bacterium]|nr:monovalent cation/H(+) antiporter subunit G [Oscillospiraceae bacterium]